MDTALIVVARLAPGEGKWSAQTHLRIGRMRKLDIILDDNLVSRLHAEIVLTDEGWIVRDLGSSNGTELNGTRLGRTGQRLRCGDIIRIGNNRFRIDNIRLAEQQVPSDEPRLHVETSASRSWHDAVEALDLPDNQWNQKGKTLLKLMRCGYRLAQAQALDDALPAVLMDAVNAFQAQCGGILLCDPITAELRIRCSSTIKPAEASVVSLSRSLAVRAFQEGSSLLFSKGINGEYFHKSDSICRANAASVICAVFRSPDQNLGVLQLHRSPDQPEYTVTDLYLADSIAAALGLGIERHQLVEDEQDLVVQTVTALAQAVEMRDRYTGNHTHRVTKYALILAEELNLPTADRRLLKIAVPLHDIGKIAIDDNILRKTGPLTESEFALMKTHVTVGADIVRTIPGLAATLPVVLSHHECWDGTGYPDGLKGEQIPLLARVVAVADAFDAMTSDRPYRAGVSAEKTLAEIIARSGTQFDPRCVEAFLRARPRVEGLMSQEMQFMRMANTQTHTISKQQLMRQMTAPR
jgi:putative nucleotidyltransferase with HDIG domain